MADRRRVVDDLVERKNTEINRHDFHDWPHAAEGSADPGADKGGFGEGRVANALGAELVEQPLGDRITAAIATDILAHQEHAGVSKERVSDRLAYRIAVGDLAHSVGHGVASAA